MNPQVLKRENPLSANIKVRRDSVYHEGRIIARYDVDPVLNGLQDRETISFFARSGLRIATAFIQPDGSTCRILTEEDQHEHFINIDTSAINTRIRQVVEYLLAQSYLAN